MTYLFGFYIVFLACFVIYSIAGIYHLWRYGYSGDLSKVIIVVYTLISVFIIVASLIFFGINDFFRQ